MKIFALILALLLADAPEFLVVTQQGEELRGTLKTKNFKLETEFGSASIDVEQVAQISFGEPDVVVTKGGVQLEGRLGLKSLRLATDAGSRTLGRAKLVTLAALVDGKAMGATDFGGPWQTSFGPMILEQNGVEVTGTYGFEDESRIEGRVEEGSFVFEWRGPGGSGEGSFELWEEADVFTGKYSNAEGRTDFWGGYRSAPSAPKPEPGQVTRGQTQSALNYHLRVPASFDGEKSFPALAFFHGSNMSSSSYVETIASVWPELADDYILVGFDGEKLSSASSPGDRRYNASYINFSGHEVGQRWRYRQTPGLVADALQELGEALPIEHWFVGGHSQGGFLTYAIVMYYPELVAGAFPMSCNLLVQCEPSNFTDAEVVAAQRAVALAPIHGRVDRVVAYSGGQYCYEAFQDGGFPALRLFDPASVGHSFMHLPVEEAVRWLESMCSSDPQALLAFANGCLSDEDYRGATAAALRAAEHGASQADVDAVLGRVDAAAAPSAARLEKAIEADADGAWVDEFWEFRRQFALAPAAEKTMALYAELRSQHQKPATDQFYASRSQDDTERKRLQLEINEKYYASSWYKAIKRWWD